MTGPRVSHLGWRVWLQLALILLSVGAVLAALVEA